MILINDKKDCCGCTACEFICPYNAISMEIDGEGFLYPKINDDCCTDCGLCKRVCSFQNGYSKEENLSSPKVYAVRHKDRGELLSSRSGAMFSALVDYTLSNQGIVYGAAFDENFTTIHKRATTKEDCFAFKGSKYVQSDSKESFIQVKVDLKEGRQVLYSGTPCHISGLQSFLKLSRIDTSKLILCDIICHGVPSPKIFDDYITYLETKYNNKISSFNFRDKDMGWHSHYESFSFKGDDIKHVKRTYTDIFYKHIMLRPCCEVCPYTNLKRPSDFTIGDYWGLDRIFNDFNKDDKGVSLVLLNSQKAMKVFDNISCELDIIKSEPAKCMQPNLEHPTHISKDRDKFWQLYYQKGFIAIAKKYGDIGIKNSIKKQYLRIKFKIKGLL